MLVTTKAIVISAIKYAEADLIVKLFTESSGLKSYHLRGVLKSKKGKFRASQFQLLTLLEIEANHKDKGTLEHLRDAKVAVLYKTLHTDVVKSTVVMFLSEMLKYAVQEEEPNSKMYHYIESSLLWYDNHNTANFHLLFLLNLTSFLGFYPDIQNFERHYFNLLDGTFEDSESNIYCISGEDLLILKTLLGTTIDAILETKLNRHNRLNFLNCMMLYYELHLQGFKKPKSLTVLKDLFY